MHWTSTDDSLKARIVNQNHTRDNSKVPKSRHWLFELGEQAIEKL